MSQRSKPQKLKVSHTTTIESILKGQNGQKKTYMDLYHLYGFKKRKHMLTYNLYVLKQTFITYMVAVMKTNILILLISLFTISDANAQCLTDAHSNVWNDGWVSCQTSANPNTTRGTGHWILYDFGSPYFLTETQIWNANEAGNTDRGVRNVVFDYSIDGTNWIELGTYEFAQAPGDNTYMGFVGPDLTGLKAQYILITALTTWGDPCAGLAEVKFNVAESIKSTISLTAMLEGPHNLASDDMHTQLNNLIPLTQPYNTAPYHYSGSEGIASITANMVDWVLVEVRQGTPNMSGTRGTTTIESQAAILLDDGSIVNTDGNPLEFNLIENEEYHFCIRHRNHLDVLTATALTAQPTMTYDFTTGTTQAFGTNQMKTLSNGTAVLFAGDFTKDGIIQTTDYNAWKQQPAQLNVYQYIDANLDGVVQVTDYDVWFPNRAKLGTVEIGF